MAATPACRAALRRRARPTTAGRARASCRRRPRARAPTCRAAASRRRGTRPSRPGCRAAGAARRRGASATRRRPRPPRSAGRIGSPATPAHRPAWRVAPGRRPPPARTRPTARRARRAPGRRTTAARPGTSGRARVRQARPVARSAAAATPQARASTVTNGFHAENSSRCSRHSSGTRARATATARPGRAAPDDREQAAEPGQVQRERGPLEGDLAPARQLVGAGEDLVEQRSGMVPAVAGVAADGRACRGRPATWRSTWWRCRPPDRCRARCAC